MRFFKQLRKIKLSKIEKEKSLNFLLSRAEPVRNYYNNRHNKQKVTFLLIFLNHKYMLAGLLIAAILAMGGGTAVAAENALPGDLLYPVKTRINEEIRSALTIRPEAKVDWEAKRAERRLQEVEKLAVESKLTTSTSEMLAAKFTEFSNRAKERLVKLEQTGKLSEEQIQQLKSNFEVAIKAHDEALFRIQEREQAKEKLRAVIDSLKDQASTTIKDRLEQELKLVKDNTSVTLKNLSENRKNAAENKISEVEKFIANNADKVSAENKTEANKKLAEAKNIIVEGDKVFAEAKYDEAIIKYSEAHRKAQEAKKYLTTSFNLEKRLNSASSTSAVKEIEEKLHEEMGRNRERKNNQ